MTSTRSIPVTDLIVGDVIVKSLGYRQSVESIMTRANDSIMPHVLVNGITTIGLRATVDIDVYDRYVAKYGTPETTTEYLARTAHLVDPNPYAGTDWEAR